MSTEFEIKSPYPEAVLSAAEKVRLLALDVDGVMTNGQLIYTSGGEEMKVFNVKDGQGINLLVKAGLQVAMITARTSPINQRRAEELGIQHVYQNEKNKAGALSQLAERLGLSLDEVAYMGDDWPDVAPLQLAGLPCCPKNAIAEVKLVCRFMTRAKGGKGAVRELADLILKSQGKLPVVEVEKEPIPASVSVPAI
ncbi:MAG: HAD hydrolase family protein [Vampirovibrio sp.]|nr:HAD hydrolase family protein [Vampirovibrio sp.]